MQRPLAGTTRVDPQAGPWRRMTNRARVRWQIWVTDRWHRRWTMTVVEWVIVLPAVLYIAWAVWGGVVGGQLPWVEDRDWCSRETECTAVLNLLKGLLAVMTSVAVFVVWRLRSAKRPIWRRVKADARDYVPTARNSILEDVVGRDELCDAISDQLRDRRARRPHLLVGGVGAGKTAVVVRLTEMLTQRGAIAVPIRLPRKVDHALDFGDLACERFCKVVDDALLTRGVSATAIGEKAWRWLRKEDRVVVLADGLEEVFAGHDREEDRDNVIRQAIQRAGEQELPLVIASRPHAPLRDVQAAITELEPLSEEAALQYIEGGRPSEDEPRLDWIVEHAEVTEAPLYLQVAKQLYDADRLEHVFGREERDTLDTRSTDRVGLRHRLLETWVESLCDGYLRQDLALRRQLRCEAVVWTAALACLGLQRDSIEVSFEWLLDPNDACACSLRTLIDDELQKIAAPNPPATLGRSGTGDGDGPDYLPGLQLAATWAEQLQLVEAHGDRVRFQHSLMQAYLGSRCVGTALDDRGAEFLSRAFGSSRRSGQESRGRGNELAGRAGAGSELLIALTFLSRNGRRYGDEHDGTAAPEILGHVVDELLHQARSRKDEKSLGMYAAALEIDRALHWSRHRTIVKAAKDDWSQLISQDEQSLVGAKINLVRRLGDALRWMAPDSGEHPTTLTATRATRTTVTSSDVIATSVTIAELGDAPTGGPRLSTAVQDSYRDLYDLGCADQDYAIRLAIAEEIGRGGNEAFDALQPALEAPPRNGEMPKSAHDAAARTVHHVPTEMAGRSPAWNERWQIIAAWLTPLLISSVRSDTRRNAAQKILRRYVDDLRDPAHARGGRPTLLTEIALAQGFKAAANRRLRHPDMCKEGKALLIEQAEELLKVSRLWYTHVTLVHALTLWSLPDTLPSTRSDIAAGAAAADHRSPRTRVDLWLSLAGKDAPTTPAQAKVVTAGEKQPPPDWPLAGRRKAAAARRRLHPFLREAGRLAVGALKSGQPQRYLWIDETGVADKIGSLPPDPHQHRVHNLWIPPSTGWTSLDPRAQQLVADIRLLIDLAYRGSRDDHDRYLERAARPGLPLCLTGDRDPMQPNLSVAKPGKSDPGLSCSDGCPFELCPYPPRGTVERKDLAEAFCRQQLALLDRRWLSFRRRWAAWQRVGLTDVMFKQRFRWRDHSVRNLRNFWEEMAERRIVPRPKRKSGRTRRR